MDIFCKDGTCPVCGSEMESIESGGNQCLNGCYFFILFPENNKGHFDVGGSINVCSLDDNETLEEVENKIIRLREIALFLKEMKEKLPDDSTLENLENAIYHLFYRSEGLRSDLKKSEKESKKYRDLLIESGFLKITE